jgi:1-deoxy-D-xylulose-5-phosphate reductoisomerase
LKNLVILGSSGSIGKNALWVAERFPEELNVFGLSVLTDTALLSEQIKRYHPKVVCVADLKAADNFALHARKLGIELFSGERGLEELASLSESDIILNSVVGFAGLHSTIAAAKAGKRIALANKESMVAGGELINEIIRNNKAEIIPVDSEHSAIFQCLKSGRKEEIRSLILTSSGGPFREFPIEKFPEITVEQSLKHPTWQMGKKITIDSATLMNKALEIIEAVYLFGVSEKLIRVVIHPQSVIHSLVEYIDGSTVAQLSQPDMRLPIQYALFYPDRRPMEIANLSYDNPFSLEFQPPNEDKFKSLRLAREALRMGGTAPAIFNAANEIAVESFLSHRINFPNIYSAVDYALQRMSIQRAETIDSIIEADKQARELARNFVIAQSV